MKIDPAEAFVRSYLDDLSVKKREALLSPYVSRSAPVPDSATQGAYLTVAQARTFFGGCGRSTLWRLEQSKDLKSYWLRGRKLFKREDLEDALRLEVK